MNYQAFRDLYCHYLQESFQNFTCTNLSDSVESVSHDKLTRYLGTYPVNEKSLFEKLHPEVGCLPSNGYLIFDDTVLDKRYSHQISMVRRQYSGNVGGTVQGIGVVVMLYYVPSLDKFYLLGYRLFDPDLDSKSKIDHVADLLDDAQTQCVAYQGVLMDTWYAVARLFQKIHHLGKYFYCPIKTNRLVKDSTAKTYSSVGDLMWNEHQMQYGKSIKVKDLDMDVKLFKVVVSTDKTDYVLTNDLRAHTVEFISKMQKMRWNIESFNREVKQLTGIDKCQCRKATAQRNHIFYAMLVWNKLKQTAYKTWNTIYQVKFEPLKKFIIERLKMKTPSFA
jgi:Transposase DDE domain